MRRTLIQTPARFTIVDGSSVTGVVTRTGNGVATLRLADGSTRKFGQCSIARIDDLTDAECLLFDQGITV